MREQIPMSGSDTRPPASMEHSARLLAELQAEFPRFRLIEKRHSRLSLLIDRLLKAVTFGGQRQFLSHYHTVIGDTLYVPSAWTSTSDVDRAIVLRHERVHLRQRRRLSMGLMAFLYLVPFFPLGLAYGRARLEWEAYSETLRATHELLGERAARDPSLRRHIVQRFLGPDYGWMWPFRSQVERWYDRALLEILGSPSDTARGDAEREAPDAESEEHA